LSGLSSTYQHDLNLVLLEDLIWELDYQVSAHSNFIYILYFLALRLLLIQYSLISASPYEGNVYEAWLQYAGGSEYRLSLGQVMENGTIDFSQNMVNPFTYTIFFKTEEPRNDVDPNPATAIAGIELKAPFGQ
jgi:hypothetical protein